MLRRQQKKVLVSPEQERESLHRLLPAWKRLQITAMQLVKKGVPGVRDARERFKKRRLEIMEIRKLDPTEHSATRSLYEEVFSEDSESFVNYYYTEKTKDNIIYAVTEDGEIRSMIHLNPYDVW